eukprot:SAG31_NODE_2692_length_5239_cov_52.795525_1_plen_287_part_00
MPELSTRGSETCAAARAAIRAREIVAPIFSGRAPSVGERAKEDNGGRAVRPPHLHRVVLQVVVDVHCSDPVDLCRVTLSRLVPYFSRLKSRICRIVAQKRESNTPHRTATRARPPRSSPRTGAPSGSERPRPAALPAGAPPSAALARQPTPGSDRQSTTPRAWRAAAAWADCWPPAVAVGAARVWRIPLGRRSSACRPESEFRSCRSGETTSRSYSAGGRDRRTWRRMRQGFRALRQIAGGGCTFPPTPPTISPLLLGLRLPLTVHVARAGGRTGKGKATNRRDAA